MSPDDRSESHYFSGGSVNVAIADLDASQKPAAGDTIEITYDGDIPETNPAQLEGVSEIVIVDKAGAAQPEEIRKMVMAEVYCTWIPDV